MFVMPIIPMDNLVQDVGLTQTPLLNVPFLDECLVVPHFEQRDRMGLLVAMAAVLSRNTSSRVRTAVGIDESSSLLLDTETGVASFVGNFGVYVVSTTTPAEPLSSGQPLSIDGLPVCSSQRRHHCAPFRLVTAKIAAHRQSCVAARCQTHNSPTLLSGVPYGATGLHGRPIV